MLAALEELWRGLVQMPAPRIVMHVVATFAALPGVARASQIWATRTRSTPTEANARTQVETRCRAGVTEQSLAEKEK